MKKVREVFCISNVHYREIDALCGLRDAAVNSDFAKRVHEKFCYKNIRITVEVVSKRDRRSA